MLPGNWMKLLIYALKFFYMKHHLKNNLFRFEIIGSVQKSQSLSYSKDSNITEDQVCKAKIF